MLRRVSGVKQHLRGSAAAFAAVFRNPNLRWLEFAWGTSILAHFAYLIAVSVYAYEAGGAEAVGLVFLIRLIPAALISPFAGLLGDRYRRDRVLLLTQLSRVVLVGAAAIGVFLDAAPVVIYALAVAATIATTPIRSAQRHSHHLARSPSELTAANAVASGVESIAFFVGPALAGLLLAIASTDAVFLIVALVLVVSAGFVALIDVDHDEQRTSQIAASTILSEAFAGFGAIARQGSLRYMMAILTAQTAVAGAVQVFIVVGAIELLDLGTAGVGYLNCAMGVGSVIGSVGALSLTGVRRLTPAFLIGALFMGIAVIGVGLWPVVAVALIMFGLFGLSSSVNDVAGLTIVQRAIPDDVLARVFGVIQMLWLSSMGIGAVIAPWLASWLGLTGALIATGAFLATLVALSWIPVGRIDAAAPPPEATELRVLTSCRSSRRFPADPLSTWQRGSSPCEWMRARSSCARAMPATASSSWPRARSRSPSMAARSRSSSRVATSARSHSYAMCPHCHGLGSDGRGVICTRPRQLPRGGDRASTERKAAEAV